MEIHCVGGAVRDILLGREPKDIDYVVVNGSHDELVSLGFVKVGASFPVYLHPDTNHEYAMARTERKVGVGYNGFECETENVTLIDDLSRRDLTINSMSVRLEDWEQFVITKDSKLVFDPFSGIDDLNWHVLRHTTEAFKCDPIRVLRTARFAARYNFNITNNTLKLMSDIVHELNHVPTERIWMEFEKGLMENYSHRMFEVLNEINAFEVEIMKPWGFLSPVNRGTFISRSALLMKAKEHKHLPTRFALIGANFDTNTFQSHCIPNECAQLCKAVTKFGKELFNFNSTPKTIRLNVIMNMRALTNQKLINDVFNVLEIIFERDIIKSSREQFADDLYAIKSINAAEIAAECKSGEEIKQKLYNARLDVMV